MVTNTANATRRTSSTKDFDTRLTSDEIRTREIAREWIEMQSLNPSLEEQAISEILRRRGPGSLLDDLEKLRSPVEQRTDSKTLHRGYIRFRAKRSR